MLPSRLWQKELIEDFKSSKALAVRFLIPLILLSPLMMSSIPPKMKAGGLAVAVIFLGIFGSAVGMARLRDDRMLERLALLPLSPASIISDYILANSLSDGLQLLVPLILVLSSGHTSPIPILWVLSCFIAALNLPMP